MFMQSVLLALACQVLTLVSPVIIQGSQGVSYEVSRSDETSLSFVVRGPASIGYAAIGIGAGMKDALMFIVRPASNAADVDVDIATAGGHVAPIIYTDSPAPFIDLISGVVETDHFVVSFTCSNCTTWSTGTVSQYTKDSRTSVIRAEGATVLSKQRRQVSNLGLSFHGNNRGIYQVDLSTDDLVGESSGRQSDKYWKTHAVLVTLGFLGVYGIGISFAVFFSQVRHHIRYHYLIQAFGTLLGIIGISFGIKAAGGNFNHAHSRFGLFLFILVFVQASLGVLQHLLYLSSVVTVSYKVARHLHRFVGSVFLFGVIVNAGLGLKLVRVSKGGQIAWYLILFLCLITFWSARRIVYRKRQDQLREQQGNVIKLGVPQSSPVTHHVP